MVNWYAKGQSQYTEGNFHMAYYIDMDGYPELNYDSQDIQGDGGNGDPFMAFAIDTETWAYGQGQVEIGLLGSHRIRINSSGVRIWTAGDVWEDPLAGGGAENLNELSDVVITDVADNELLAWDTSTSKWINQTASEADLATTGDLHSESHSLSSHSSEAHNELTGYNDETDVKHLTDAQLGALHTIYSLEVHDNDEHDPDYEVANANIQSHVASPVTDAHHTLYTLEQHNNSFHSTNYHTESDGTGVVTVHSDITSVGSGAIITTGERNALHPIVTAVFDLDCLDDRDYKPNTADSYGFVQAFFTSLGGMTGVADSDYQDLLILNTYTDASGGDINALTFDKSTQLIKHWLADQAAATWGTPKTIAYVEDIHAEGHVLATTGSHTGSLPLTDLDSWVAGNIIIGGAADWEVLVKGTATYVLKMGATYPAWGQVGWTEVTGKPTEFTPISHDNTYHSTNYKIDFSENTAFNKDFGAVVTTVCQGNDSRLSDSRTPVNHANEAHNPDFCVNNDSRLSDARTPVSHNNDYHSETYITDAGADARIALANHDTLLLPNGNAEEQHMTSAQITALHPKQHAMDAIAEHTRTDIAVLDASTSFHGFLKKLDNVATNFMNGQGAWAVPAGQPDAAMREQSSTFPVSPNEGDLHYDEDDDSLYRYNAEALAWVEVGTMGAVASVTDNLGNHTATEDLAMGAFDITLDALSTVDGVDVSVLNTTVGALYSAAQINQLLCIGTGNKGICHLSLDGGYRIEADLMDYATANHGNRDGTDFVIYFQIPRPLTLPNGLHLHVDYLYVFLIDADTSNYLNDVKIIGKNTTSTTVLYNLATNQTTVGLKTFPTGTDDWGDYKAVRVGINVIATTQLEWEMSSIYVRYWYA